MIRPHHLALGFSCALATLLSSCATTGNPDACSLEGFVFDQQTGNPAPGISVALGVVDMLAPSEKPVIPYGGDHPYVTTTGRDGTFHFRDLKPGPLLVMTQDDELACVEGEVPVELAASEYRKNITLHVARGASISGTIYNDGYYHGVEGVAVQVVPNYENRKEWVRAYETVSSADGTFHIGGIPSGSYDIRSSPLDGFQQSSLAFYGEEPIHHMTGYFQGFPMEWGTHYESFEFTVAPGALARGVVVDEAGQPVTGAEIFYFGRGPVEPGEVLTDERGQFLYPNDERLEVPNIIARKDGHFSERLNSDKTLEEYGPIRLTLRPGANLRVRVVDEKGEPIGWPIEIDIDVDYQGDNYSPYERAKEPDHGLFTFPTLPAATYELGIWGTHRDYITEKPGPFALNPGDDREIVLIANNTAELHGLDILGKVAGPDGAPIANAHLEAMTIDPFQTTTGPDGTFTFRTRSAKSLPTYQSQEILKTLDIRVSAPGYMEQVVHARPGDSDVHIALEPTRTLSGYVVDASTGNPIETFDATVYSTSDPGNPDRRYWTKQESVALHNKGSGEFEISGITSSPFIVEIESEAFGKHHIEVDSDLEKSTTPHGFGLNPKGHLRGIVLDQRNIPIGNADIHTSAARRLDLPEPDKRIAAGLRANTTSDANGKFFLPLEAAGRVSLLVRSPYPDHREEIEVPVGGLDDLRIVVPDGVSIRGRVTVGGEPLTGAVVAASRESQVVTDSRGEYMLTGLPHGQNDVTFGIPENLEQRFMRSKIVSTNVVAGQTGELNMEFVPGTASLEGRVRGKGCTAGQSATLLARLADGEQIVVSTPIDKDGLFRLSKLPASDAWVTIRIPEVRKHIVPVTLQTGKSEQLDIDLEPVTTVSGTLVRGAFVGPVRIVAIPGVPPIVESDTDRLGLSLSIVAGVAVDGDTFVLENIPPGTVTIVCLTESRNNLGSRTQSELARTTIDIGPDGVIGVELGLEDPANQM